MRIRPASILIAVLVAGCQAPAPSSNSSAPPALDAMQATEAASRAHESYVRAINSNNLDTLLSVLTDDVVFMAPNEPVYVGKEALKPWLEGYLRAYRTRWDKPVQEFVVTGDWAFERYSYHSTDTPLGGGKAVEDTGWGLLIYHHDADGRWRVARDAWGQDHPGVSH
jgi:ketosteroid isomerase-like protein